MHRTHGIELNAWTRHGPCLFLSFTCDVLIILINLYVSIYHIYIRNGCMVQHCSKMHDACMAHVRVRALVLPCKLGEYCLGATERVAFICRRQCIVLHGCRGCIYSEYMLFLFTNIVSIMYAFFSCLLLE